MRGKCERGHGSANADGAGAEVFAGDGCSQGASFGPMVAISRRGQGGRIYNNTRARELLRRMCVKPAALTTHSPPKTSAPPRTATPPSRAFSHSIPEHFRSSTQRRRTPTDLTTHSPPKICSRPRTTTRPSPALLPHPRSPDARPPTSRPIPCRRPSPATAQRHALPLPSCHIPAAPTHARRLRDAFLSALTTHSPQRRPASPSVPRRTQKNGTAQCMCDAECLGRPSLRSVIGVGEPRAVRRRCGALACRRGA